MDERDRSELAQKSEAARRIASRFGIQEKPKLLGHSKNTSLLFGDAGIVARVSGAASRASLARELDVARHLARKKAPSILPAMGELAGPHMLAQFAVTLWTAETVDESVDMESDHAQLAAGRALQELHAALADYPGQIPSFRTQIDKCRRTLGGDTVLSNLPVRDRNMLASAGNLIAAKLDQMSFPETTLHGDAHIGNAIATNRGMIWLDFEDICKGPREWDYCRFGTPDPFSSVDHPLYGLLSVLRSVCLATWCWESSSDPAKLEAARHHTDIVRKHLFDSAK